MIEAHLEMYVGISESFTISDVMSATLAAAIYERAVSESISISDTASASITFETFISESFTVSDTVSAQAIFEAAISESAAINDSMSIPSLGQYLIATLNIYAALSAASTTISPGLNASSINIKPD